LQQSLNLKFVFAALTIVCLTASISAVSTATLGTTIPQTNTTNATSAQENDIRELELKGLVLHFLGKNNEAISFFDKALAINPNYKLALDNNRLAHCRRSIHLLGKTKKHLIFANFISTAEKFTYQVKRGPLPYVNRVNEREKSVSKSQLTHIISSDVLKC
jgi:tetratricopeptide (TPR) repeat protein